MICKITLRSSLSNDPENNFQRSFHKSLDLPFAPVVGMELSPVNWITFAITECIFDVQGNYFEIKASQKRVNAFEGDLEHIANALLGAGWADSN